MFPIALQPHSKNKMTAQRDSVEIRLLFIHLELQAHVDCRCSTM